MLFPQSRNVSTTRIHMWPCTPCRYILFNVSFFIDFLTKIVPNPADKVMESVVKNCGSPIHDEVASKAFMDELREMVHKTTNDQVRAKVLELVQTWAFAFRNSPKYSIIPVSAVSLPSLL